MVSRPYSQPAYRPASEPRHRPTTDDGEPQAYIMPACSMARGWIAFRAEKGRWRYAGAYDSEEAAIKALEQP